MISICSIKLSYSRWCGIDQWYRKHYATLTPKCIVKYLLIKMSVKFNWTRNVQQEMHENNRLSVEEKLKKKKSIAFYLMPYTDKNKHIN